MIKLITFDLDNTLWEVTPVIIKAEKTMREWLSERIENYRAVVTGELMSELRDTALKADPQLRYNISDMRVLLLTQAIARCGVSANEAQAFARDAFAIFMQGRNDVTFYPEALPAIESLATEYRLAGLTNGNADISGMPLAEHFEFSMSPDQVQSRKPEPAIFSATLERAGLAAHEVIHVGDHLHGRYRWRNGRWLANAIWANLAGEGSARTASNYSASHQIA